MKTISPSCYFCIITQIGSAINLSKKTKTKKKCCPVRYSSQMPPYLVQVNRIACIEAIYTHAACFTVSLTPVPMKYFQTIFKGRIYCTSLCSVALKKKEVKKRCWLNIDAIVFLNLYNFFYHLIPLFNCVAWYKYRISEAAFWW